MSFIEKDAENPEKLEDSSSSDSEDDEDDTKENPSKAEDSKDDLKGALKELDKKPMLNSERFFKNSEDKGLRKNGNVSTKDIEKLALGANKKVAQEESTIPEIKLSVAEFPEEEIIISRVQQRLRRFSVAKPPKIDNGLVDRVVNIKI